MLKHENFEPHPRHHGKYALGSQAPRAPVLPMTSPAEPALGPARACALLFLSGPVFNRPPRDFALANPELFTRFWAFLFLKEFTLSCLNFQGRWRW